MDPCVKLYVPNACESSTRRLKGSCLLNFASSGDKTADGSDSPSSETAENSH